MKKSKLAIQIKHPGSFTEWCNSKGHNGVTCSCIVEGLRSKSAVTRKKANFARNFGHKDCKV